MMRYVPGEVLNGCIVEEGAEVEALNDIVEGPVVVAAGDAE
jgi:hypothetical protein